jgi:hypothetical protein
VRVGLLQGKGPHLYSRKEDVVARDIGEGLEWDPKDAKKWSKEDFENNCRYLIDRGGDVPGTTENTLLLEIIEKRVGADKVEETVANIYQQKFEEVEAPETEAADGVPADEFEPATKGAKK